MSTADFIPDRRRNHFPTNGGPRPNDDDKERGHRGAAAAREVLDDTTAPRPTDPAVVRQLGTQAISRARRGLRAARASLRRITPDE